VNKCIVDLSTSGAKKDINDSIGKWGDGKYLYMDIDPSNLCLVDPFDLTVLNTQAIKTLRAIETTSFVQFYLFYFILVNMAVLLSSVQLPTDFAYVARDKSTRAFACHVFRCDQPARHIASTLCHVCKMAVARKNSKLLSSTYSSSSAVACGSSSSNGSRPNNLPDFDGGSTAASGCGEVLAKYEDLLKNSSFPTPMDEPKKVIYCHYLGTIQVSMPTGE
ncbi:hypothetical protein HELRODRAFT_184585, partial [Helobdella robusta]|uniref:PID domain-containing protein n=1 Tax=Helobdella robusta TaxID=6412 RepID=T1FLJ2_HELRO